QGDLNLCHYNPVQRQVLADRRGPHLRSLLQRALPVLVHARWDQPLMPAGLYRDLIARDRPYQRLVAQARLFPCAIEDAMLLLSISLDPLALIVLQCSAGPLVRPGPAPRQHDPTPPLLRAPRQGFWLRELRRSLEVDVMRLARSADRLREMRISLGVPF